MFSADLLARAEKLLAEARAKGLKVATAESCTGGLVAGLLTEIPGSSDVVERGFVTYSNEAKEELLGVPREILKAHGAVSAETARAMVQGALKQSRADLAVAVTGIAGPGGGTADKPVGLVHFAAARWSIDQAERSEAVRACDQKNFQVLHRECRFGDIGRTQVRLKSVEVAIGMLEQLL
jgi:nicotinamide-nucleotide amidase